MSRRNKFGAVKTTVDGITFDSRAEASRFAVLRAMQRAKIISGLELQPEFPFIINGEPVRALSKSGKGRPLKAVMDFRFFKDGAWHVEDVKGIDTAVSRLKRAFVHHLYGIKIEVVK